jgi:hypothetical protein
MKKTNLLFAVIAFFIALSCSKSSTSSSSSSGQKKVKTVKKYDVFGNNRLTEEWFFSYDNNERISSIIKKDKWTGEAIFEEISYVDPYNTVVTTYKDSIKIVSKKYSISYIKLNSNGNVIYDSTVIEDSVVSITNHNYYGDSVWIKRPYKVWNNYRNSILDIDKRFKVINENYSDVRYTYDTKANPLYRLKSIFGYYYNPSFWHNGPGIEISKNNILEKNPVYNNQGDLFSCYLFKSNSGENIRFEFTYY